VVQGLSNPMKPICSMSAELTAAPDLGLLGPPAPLAQPRRGLLVALRALATLNRVCVHSCWKRQAAFLG
jgi:hypothetical protein